MRIVTNPGSNLSSAEVAKYGVQLTSQIIVVDDVSHEAQGIALKDIDEWVNNATVHPYVVGTTASEFAGVFRDLAKSEEEVIVVMTSKKIIGSYDAALSASGTLASHPGFEGAKIHVLDSGSTDLGAGLSVILVGEAIAAGLTAGEIAALLETYRAHACFITVPDTLDSLVKGGRATPLRAWLANLLSVRPMIGFVDGEIAVIGKVRVKEDRADAIANYAVKEYGEGRSVWIGVVHGDAPERAQAVEDALKARFDVRFSLNRELSPSIYLHTGPGSVGAIIVPLDELPFSPPMGL